jgi:hypothetical protein
MCAPLQSVEHGLPFAMFFSAISAFSAVQDFVFAGSFSKTF